MRPARRTHRRSPASLRAAIGIDRRGRGVNRPGRGARAAKHIVGGNLHEGDARLRAGACHRPRRRGVDALCQRLLGLGTVNGGVGGGVDDRAGTGGGNQHGAGGGVGQISLGAASRAHARMPRQRPRQLPGLAKDQHRRAHARGSQPLADARAASNGRHQASFARYHATRAPQPFGQRYRWLPAQLGADARGVDRVARIMAGAVGNKGDQAVVRRALGVHLVHQRADHPHQVDVARLGLAADVVAAPHRAAGQHRQQRLGVVFDKEPVAHILARAVNRDRPARQRVQDHHRNELFGKVVGPVVVRAIAQHHRQAVGLMPGAHQMVRCRLAGRIGAARGVGGGLR